MEKLIEARKKMNLLQRDVAELVGISRLAYINIESKKSVPSVKVALDIAKTLHSTVEELFEE